MGSRGGSSPGSIPSVARLDTAFATKECRDRWPGDRRRRNVVVSDLRASPTSVATISRQGRRRHVRGRPRPGRNHVWSQAWTERPGWRRHRQQDRIAVAGGFWRAWISGWALIPTTRSSRPVVAEFDSVGQHVWSNGTPLIAEIVGSEGVAVDSGDSVLWRLFPGNIDLGGDCSLARQLHCSSPRSLERDHVWSTHSGASGDFAASVAVDSADDVFVAGEYDGMCNSVFVASTPMEIPLVEHLRRELAGDWISANAGHSGWQNTGISTAHLGHLGPI